MASVHIDNKDQGDDGNSPSHGADIAVNEESKAIVHQTLDELGLEYLPTNTNFIMHRINGDLETYRNRMRAEGLLVGRNFPPMLDHNRLSFGLPDEMAQWADAIKGFRQKGWI